MYLQELKGDYKECLKSFMKSDSDAMKVKVFDWLHRIFEKISGSAKDQVKQEVLHYLNDMVAVDSDRTAKLVRDFYENEHRSIVGRLDNAPKLQLKYLAEIVKALESDEELEDNLVHLYVKRLCELEPHNVLKFLQSSERYSLDKCLTLCSKNNIIDASAYLYERLGDTKAALELYLNIVEQKQTELEASMRTRSKNTAKLEEEMNVIVTDISNAVDLCRRNANKLDEHDNEENWFRLLDRVLYGYGQMEPHFERYRSLLEPILSAAISNILSQMILSVDFNKIVTRIAANFGSIPFKYFKTDFVNVLSRYSYQKNILRKANNLLNRDIKTMTQELLSLRMRGVSSMDLRCALCTKPMSNEDMLKETSEKLLLFTCGHVYHSHCLKRPICEVCRREETRKGTFISASR